MNWRLLVLYKKEIGCLNYQNAIWKIDVKTNTGSCNSRKICCLQCLSCFPSFLVPFHTYWSRSPHVACLVFSYCRLPVYSKKISNCCPRAVQFTWLWNYTREFLSSFYWGSPGWQDFWHRHTILVGAVLQKSAHKTSHRQSLQSLSLVLVSVQNATEEPVWTSVWEIA